MSKSQNSKCSPSYKGAFLLIIILVMPRFSYQKMDISALLGFQISKRQSIREHAIDQASFHMTNGESLKRKFKETKLFLKAHNMQ